MLIIGIITLWFICGWISGKIIIKSFKKEHLSADNCEYISRVFIIGGILNLIASLIVYFSSQKCNRNDHSYCEEWMQKNKPKNSWFFE